MQWAGNRGSWGERGQQRESMGTLSSFCSVFCKAKTTLKKSINFRTEIVNFGSKNDNIKSYQFICLSVRCDRKVAIIPYPSHYH